MKTEELKKIVGSLLIVGFEGTKLSDSCRNFLEQWDLGGVILFKRNIESLEQLVALNETIYSVARVTPMISVDHEGGRVFRLPDPFTVFPPMERVGAACLREKSLELARRVGEAFGRELRAVGFNVDWAPVLDVNSNPKNPVIGDRAFSSRPEQTASAALSFWKGLQGVGVLGCGKHFPGHGDTTEDSHETLPVVKKSREDLERCELVPFRQAVTQKIPLLMTAHVRYPSLDSEWPASLSEKILSGLLKKELGFGGLVVSDDLFMKGITARWSVEEAAERFLRAGGDLVLLCHQEAVQRRVAAHLVHAAEKDGGFLGHLLEKSKRLGGLREKLAMGTEVGAFSKWAQDHRSLARALA